MIKRSGFSLAEVLITLAVIGIIAGLTVPAIISNTNGAKFRSQFKKTVSVLNQAGLLAKANYGYDFAATESPCPTSVEEANNQHPDAHQTFCSLMNATLAGKTYYGKVTNIKRKGRNEEVEYKLETRETLPDNYTEFLAYALNDGIIVAFHPNAKNCELPLGRRPVQAVFSGEVDGANMSECIGFIDVNGASLPNREVKCSKGVNKVDAGSNCYVGNNASRFVDVYPIFFNGASVEPASGAAKYVLDTEKS